MRYIDHDGVRAPIDVAALIRADELVSGLDGQRSTMTTSRRDLVILALAALANAKKEIIGTDSLRARLASMPAWEGLTLSSQAVLGLAPPAPQEAPPQPPGEAAEAPKG